MQAMEISRTALDVEWRRIEIASQNLANINSAAGPSGAVYRARHLLSGPAGDFASHLENGSAADLHALRGVAVTGIVEDNAPPRLVHEPGNPAADANGMVAYPAIDHAQEMLTLVQSSRVYEANVVAMNAARQIYTKALEIGRHS